MIALRGEAVISLPRTSVDEACFQALLEAKGWKPAYVPTAILANRGPGMHHVAYEVDDLRETLAHLARSGAELIDDEPRQGLFGLEVAFVHPHAVHGVLSEVVAND